MRVKSRMAVPVKQRDDKWKAIVKEFEEDVPVLGRISLMYNACGVTSYPNSMRVCPIGKKYMMLETQINESLFILFR